MQFQIGVAKVPHTHTDVDFSQSNNIHCCPLHKRTYANKIVLNLTLQNYLKHKKIMATELFETQKIMETIGTKLIKK